MKKALKWIGAGAGALLVLVLALLGYFFWQGGRYLAASRATAVAEPPAPADERALARGAHLTAVYCTVCHGDDLGGAAFTNDPAFAVVPAPNLTRGRGGVGAAYDRTAWVRALRHGVGGRDGRALFVMPAEFYVNFSGEDLAAIIAYLETAAPVDRELPARRFGPVGRTLVGAGSLRAAFPFERIDHSAPFASAPPPGATAEYGGYLARTFGCAACHGEDFAGGPAAGAPEVFAPNLTPGGALSAWNEESFRLQSRSRVGEHMPWKALARMTDEELAALWHFLAALPARTTAATPG